jgi:hypothetical protein
MDPTELALVLLMLVQLVLGSLERTIVVVAGVVILDVMRHEEEVLLIGY